MIELFFTNTLSGKKEKFIPQIPNKVSLYVCGVTPYDYSHIGHGRVYVTFDMLYRLFKLLGYNCTYCRNFTDIDDKLLARAEKEFGDPLRYPEIAQRYINAYLEDMQQLNCLSPDIQPRVTETIPEIIQFVSKLIEKGNAYVTNGSVYYAVESFREYGKLSKQDQEELQAGARVAPNEQKKNPLDFALWKAEKPETFWKSPWGWGRPGWHIECSAMVAKFLGEHIDLHGGGRDLIFPHHENEIAQSEGIFGKPFARYWVHNAFVQIDKEKMSKSLGNFFTIREIISQYDPMVLRYYFVTHNYGAPLDFAPRELARVQKSYQKLCRAIGDVTPITNRETLLANTVTKELIATLADDLNSAKMFGIIFDNLTKIKEDEHTAACVKGLLQSVVGLSMQPLAEKEAVITPELQELINKRAAARAIKDWKTADAIRDQLLALGVKVQDTPDN